MQPSIGQIDIGQDTIIASFLTTLEKRYEFVAAFPQSIRKPQCRPRTLQNREGFL